MRNLGELMDSTRHRVSYGTPTFPTTTGAVDHASHPEALAGESGDHAISDSALTLAVGGDAFAQGNNTLTDGATHTQVKEFGPVTEAIGSATFVAIASGGPTTAAADTFANVFGADFVYEVTVQSGPVVGGAGTVESTSQTKVLAIDIAGLDMPGGPVVFDFTLQRASYASLVQPSQIALSGHAATVTSDANAIGDNTFADTQTFASTDNAFSFVSGLSLSGVA
jgi:hypothetical protein